MCVIHMSVSVSRAWVQVSIVFVCLLCVFVHAWVQLCICAIVPIGVCLCAYVCVSLRQWVHACICVCVHACGCLCVRVCFANGCTLLNAHFSLHSTAAYTLGLSFLTGVALVKSVPVPLEICFALPLLFSLLPLLSGSLTIEHHFRKFAQIQTKGV